MIGVGTLHFLQPKRDGPLPPCTVAVLKATRPPFICLTRLAAPSCCPHFCPHIFVLPSRRAAPDSRDLANSSSLKASKRAASICKVHKGYCMSLYLADRCSPRRRLHLAPLTCTFCRLRTSTSFRACLKPCTTSLFWRCSSLFSPRNAFSSADSSPIPCCEKMK